MFDLIGDCDDGLVAGTIKLVLVHQGSFVHFVIQEYQAVLVPNMGVYSFAATERMCCVKHENLLDYYPLPEYRVCGMPVLWSIRREKSDEDNVCLEY